MIEARWCCPRDIQLAVRSYKEKVDHRLAMMIAEWNPSVGGLLKKGIYEPIKTTVKILIKASYLRLRFPARELVPLRYEFYRIYSQWVIARTVWGRFFQAHH